MQEILIKMFIEYLLKLDNPGVAMLLEVLVLVHLLAFLIYVVLLTKSFFEDKSKNMKQKLKKIQEKND